MERKIEITEMKYIVKKATTVPVIDSAWDKNFWKEVTALRLNNFMGKRPEHFPEVQTKLCYDKHYLYVIFHVKDRYVRAVERNLQGMVCKDSCVEFFFTPGTDISIGYFNFEINCGGTFLFHFQKSRGCEVRNIFPEHCSVIKVAHSLPKIVEPEITEPTTWTVEYALPFEILPYYAPVIMPESGVIWKANFYKCGDATSHPHWLTWSRVEHPVPNFHLPAFFGTLEFE